MQSILVAIAGGSGAGKSTACYKLVDEHPEVFEVINLDDYQKVASRTDLPMLGNKINWDHPDAIDWPKLTSDLARLKTGESVTIDSWSHRSNPDYVKHRQMVTRTIQPKPIVLLEGYMALYNPDVVKLCAHTYYLDLDDATRSARRGKNDVIADPDYEAAVLIPMHKKYVEPTKAIAGVVIDTSSKSVQQIAEQIYADLH